MIIRRNSAFLLLFCIFLIGCGSIGDPANSTDTTSPRNEFTEADVEMTSPAARTLQINEVRVPAEGIDLAGTLYVLADLPAPRPGIILLHMLRQDRSSWDAFARQLADAGYTALSVDLRGHGETGGVVDWDLAVADLQQAWQFLAGKDEINQDRTGFIGASIGANLALITAAEAASVRAVVLLSPGLDYSGVGTTAAIEAYGDRPIFLAASQDDPYAADSTVTLENEAVGEAKLIIYETAGHGTNMLVNEPGLPQQIIAWLDAHLK